MGHLEFAMSQYFRIHPQNPQPRLIAQAVTLIRAGAVIAYPTDSSYALGCSLGDKSAMERIRRIRQVDENHEFTLVCRDLAQGSAYAQVDNVAYRTIRAVTPGAYTFILRCPGWSWVSLFCQNGEEIIRCNDRAIELRGQRQ